MKLIKTHDLVKTTALVSIINVAYAIANLWLGANGASWWFISLGVYYIILSAMRFVVVVSGGKASDSFILGFSGYMLMMTALPLLVITILCVITDRGTPHHQIIMIAMALYAFTKVTLAIINLIKVRKTSGRVYRALRNISLADALVSIASLQRSMLVSFGDMPAADIQLFNALTGTGVCIIIALLGIEQIVTLKRINKKHGIQP